MNKNRQWMLVIPAMLLTPSLAWANPLTSAVIGNVLKALKEHCVSSLFPGNLPHWSLAILASALTLTWMLGVRPLRNIIGRYLGPVALAVFAIMFVINYGPDLLFGVFLALPWWVEALVVLSAYWLFKESIKAGIMAIKNVLTGGIKKLWSWSVDASKKGDGKEGKQEDAWMFWVLAVMGALVLSGALNGLSAPNGDLWYGPSIASSLGGLYWLYRHYIRKEVCPKCKKKTLGHEACSACDYKRPAKKDVAKKAEGDEHHEEETPHHIPAPTPPPKQLEPPKAPLALPPPREKCPKCEQMTLTVGKKFCSSGCGYARPETGAGSPDPAPQPSSASGWWDD